ncbi:MAG: PQQ-binding-like beta-propeller repeat protein [Thermoplasmata archaeon]
MGLPLDTWGRPSDAVWIVGIALLVGLPVGALGGLGAHAGGILGPGPNDAATGTSATPFALAATMSGSSAPTPRSSSVLTVPSFAKNSQYDWPELHQNPLLTGIAPNSTLSTANASSLGVAWATDIYSAALDSPVVAYDPLLQVPVAYIATENGNLLGVNVVNGQIIWGVWLGSAIRSTPLVNDGAVWAITSRNPTIFKLNATTGVLDCSHISQTIVVGTPTLVTPPGGVPTLYIGSEDGKGVSGQFMAIQASNCALEWGFTGYPVTQQSPSTGSWVSTAYVVNATGTPLVIFGTADPDSSEYALNALTGKEVWRFQTNNPAPYTYDVGAGAPISPPGINGFPDGVAYVTNKFGMVYELNLTSGTPIWTDTLAGSVHDGISTPALVGSNLVVGYYRGMVDLNASSGALLWTYQDPTTTVVDSSPAISGPTGKQVVVFGDIGGGIEVLALSTGQLLYHYQTGSYIAGSPAVTDGNILLASGDGFLYDLAVGGGNDAVLPSASITSPVTGSTVSNPNGNLTIVGSASDPQAVVGVQVAIQSGGPAGAWWDATSGTWSSGPMGNPATLGSPGAKSTTWTFQYPVPPGGGTYEVTAYAISSSGQSAIHAAVSGYAVLYNNKGPFVKVSSDFVAPGGSVRVSGGGFADSEKVSLSLDGAVLVNVQATATGTFSTTVMTIPKTTAFGQASMVATGLTSGTVVTTALTVVNDWDEAGYDSERVSYEPNDRVLNTHVNPGGENWLLEAWHFELGAKVNGSVVIANQVAYVSDRLGDMLAIDVTNGGLIWNWSVPSGAALYGAPSVDPSLGLVFVGANDGSLYAVSTATGTLVWSHSVGGNLTSPVFFGGEVYVTSNTGRVAALSEAAGVLSWSITLSSPIFPAATLDPMPHVLVVGEQNGDLVALNTSSGNVIWTYATGGPIRASATVSGGVVYAGSSDDYVYALNEFTGVKIWSYLTGGPVDDTGAVTDSGTPGSTTELFIGSNDGHVYTFLTGSGALEFTSVGYGAAIVGIATNTGEILLTTSVGHICASPMNVADNTWTHATGAAVTTAAVIVDGTVYVITQQGDLEAFTAYGQPPV